VFERLMIVNRGEIAVRVMRTCRELGIETVAVHSDVDAGAYHVRFADRAHSLGGTTAAESYLHVDKVLEAAHHHAVDAIHPGYGFLSERSDFARSVEAAGMTFVGPPASSMDQMSDKISSRIVAESAGVASVPGTSEPLLEAAEAAAFGAKYGWPIAVKAAYGGGGRGLRVIHGPDELEAAIDAARRESLAYFGRDEVYLERYLDWPRHIEIQILADQHGGVVYLGDRDCSSQRRHQKLVEEGPAPGLSDATRRAMGEAAVAVSRAVGYVGVGTVEMLYQDDEFWFLEMNTRLQVEHPVTEMITGIDLVAEQLRVASGEPLGYEQNDVRLDGHAIEIRINAEDPAGGRFVPSPGRLRRFSLPAGPSVRVDAGYQQGDDVSPHYDNLVAKVVVWAPDRAIAIERARRALRELDVDGVATTAGAADAILAHAHFHAVEHSTIWVEHSLDLSHLQPYENDLAARGGNGSGNGDTTAGEVSSSRRTVVVGGREYTIPLLDDGNGQAGGVVVHAADAPVANRNGSSGRSRGGVAGHVVAPMQGTVVSVLAVVGDRITADQVLIVFEAMKMENQLTAGVDGVVTSLVATVGVTAGAGDVLAVVEPDPEQTSPAQPSPAQPSPTQTGSGR
jgi:acetyl-CoA/propionyl-CoA carboxylase biotin carboxyl carrier protein